MAAAARKTAERRSAPASGDPAVVAHPAFRKVPPSLFRLQTEEGQAEYDTIARLLYERGRLTAAAHRALSSYAMQFETIQRLAAEGKPVRNNAFMNLDKARRELSLDDLDKPIAAPSGAPRNKFARTGFSNRR